MRQSAWLNATPEKAKHPRIKSRPHAELPPIESGRYLLDVMMQIGPTVPAGMGEGPITDQDLAAWQTNQCVRLRGWECQAIRQLSREWCAMAGKAREKTCPQPYIGPVEMNEQRREKVAQAMRDWAKKLNETAKK